MAQRGHAAPRRQASRCERCGLRHTPHPPAPQGPDTCRARCPACLLARRSPPQGECHHTHLEDGLQQAGDRVVGALRRRVQHPAGQQRLRGGGRVGGGWVDEGWRARAEAGRGGAVAKAGARREAQSTAVGSAGSTCRRSCSSAAGSAWLPQRVAGATAGPGAAALAAAAASSWAAPACSAALSPSACAAVLWTSCSEAGLQAEGAQVQACDLRSTSGGGGGRRSTKRPSPRLAAAAAHVGAAGQARGGGERACGVARGPLAALASAKRPVWSCREAETWANRRGCCASTRETRNEGGQKGPWRRQGRPVAAERAQRACRGGGAARPGALEPRLCRCAAGAGVVATAACMRAGKAASGTAESLPVCRAPSAPLVSPRGAAAEGWGPGSPRPAAGRRLGRRAGPEWRRSL